MTEGMYDNYTPPSAAERLELLRLMTLARLSDEREGVLFRQGRAPFQVSSAGHEGLAVIQRGLRTTDLIFPHYRDRALMLARGLSLRDLALDFFAKRESGGGGRQLPCHYTSRALNIVSLASPTGLQCLPAAGAAWGAKLRGREDVVVCLLGDASARQGEFYEAVCFAVQKSLPVIFVVEDNGYGVSTPTRDLDPFRLDVLSHTRMIRVDGRQPEALDAAFQAAVAQARRGGGPAVLLAEMDRLGSHASADDHRLYRPREELDASKARDPVAALERAMISEGVIDSSAWAAQKAELIAEVTAAYDRAEKADDPLPGDASRHTLDETTAREPPSAPLGEPAPATMLEGYNRTLAELMADDPGVVLFGLDIEDPKGGVFGLTRGLSTRFPDRVFNAPLAEATIAGVGAGLAMTGFRPVVELQFIDFVGPGFTQITSQIATLRWRSNGDWSCPITIVAPAGAYLPSGGPWHSQSNEAWFAHTPGLRVCMPSTAADTSAILSGAVRGDDPTLILLPKHLLRLERPLLLEASAQTGSYVRRKGDDLTLVAWGNTVPICLEAAEVLQSAEVEAEVIDLCCLAPCDWGVLKVSLRKTGRLIVVQEDVRSASVGQAVIAELIADPAVWRAMYAPPVLVSRGDVQVGYHPRLESAVLPQVQDLLEAARSVLEFAP
jgi:2-oxoisovalerate dehydrogenase E1 component